MSKIAIISDIHSNKHTLDLVLKDIERKGINEIWCLGDLVTKYYYPAQVVDAIAESCKVVIKGNCDDIVASDERYKYARGQLGQKRIEYLDNLPVKKQLMLNKVLLNLYHSNPRDLDTMFNPLFSNENTRYKDTAIKTQDYHRMFEDDKNQVSIVGHTHMNYMAVERDNQLVVDNNLSKITPNDRAILNAGSVAEHIKMVQRMDGSTEELISPYVTYLILDTDHLTEGINVQMVYIDCTDTLINVFMDSAYSQMAGKFPFSPNDTKKIENSIETFDKNERVKGLVNETYQEYLDFADKRNGGKGR